MSLNLIDDPWVPVRCADGTRRVIAPWQMAEAEVVFPDWPRADLNVACLEMLIGLVFLADPPEDIEDWRQRRAPDPQRLRARLAAYAPAFELLGDGPRFLQDLERLEGEANPTDLLFIDSAGANTARNNADLMVRRDRYGALSLPMAAMALYTFQAFAPSGGAGNRTSLRGGGPMVTLIDPRDGPTRSLWDMIWANVPEGLPGKPGDLPWMRPTLVSDSDSRKRFAPEDLFDVEAFFGMPRRLRLIAGEGGVTGVIQKPWGTNYALWKHPLTPHYRMKEGAEWLPKHPRAGRFGYRNWLGVITQPPNQTLSEQALALRSWGQRRGGGSVLVAGWSMDNMKPRDFVLSIQPFPDLDAEAATRLAGLVNAAEAVAVALRGALEPVLAAGEAREAEREAFFLETEVSFLGHLSAIRSGGDPAQAWLADLRAQALTQFDALAVPGLDQRDSGAIREIVMARRYLDAALSGFGKQGREIFVALGLEAPERKKGKAA